MFHFLFFKNSNLKLIGLSVHSIVANVQGFDIVASEFDFQLHFYVHFLSNTVGKGMDALFWIAPQLIFHKNVVQSAGAVEYTVCFSAEG